VEEIPAYINLLSYLFVVVYMLSVPLETTRGEIIKALGDFNMMGRALLANFIIIPSSALLSHDFLIYRRISEPDSSCSPWPRVDCSLYSLPASPMAIESSLSRSYLFSACWPSWLRQRW
jgi:hypothetical protein